MRGGGKKGPKMTKKLGGERKITDAAFKRNCQKIEAQRVTTIPQTVIDVVERHRAALDAQGWWTEVAFGQPAALPPSPQTYAKLEYGSFLPGGERERSCCTRFYYEDGTYYTAVQL